ncbi:MAG: hypothetical protein ACOCQR_00895 [bacterium]
MEWAIVEGRVTMNVICSGDEDEMKNLYCKATHDEEYWAEIFPEESVEDIQEELKEHGLDHWTGDLMLIEVHGIYK